MLPGVGSDFGRYRITGRLGRGGMGVVFSAVHRDLERPVALKLLTPDLSGDESYRKRFLREARILARLDTPYVVRVYDAGEQDGWLFIATELIADGDLKELLDAGGPLPIPEAVELVAQVAEGLAVAHDNGILHRDIKPSNVLLRRLPNGTRQAVLCDLGIAMASDVEATQTVGVIGTPTYMSPERHQGEDATVASDIYALGCVLWATLTGNPPYQGTAAQVFRGHLNEPTPQLDGDADVELLNALIAESMAKEPAGRFASARDLGAALRSIRAEAATKVTEVVPPPADIAEPKDTLAPVAAGSPELAEQWELEALTTRAAHRAESEETDDLYEPRTPHRPIPMAILGVLMLAIIVLITVLIVASAADDDRQKDSDGTSRDTANVSAGESNSDDVDQQRPSERTTKPTHHSSENGRPNAVPQNYEEALARVDYVTSIGGGPSRVARFSTPDEAIYCLLSDVVISPSCELVEPIREGECQPVVAGVGRIETFRGSVSALCNSDTIREPGADTVVPPSTVDFFGGRVTCSVERIGVTCIDAMSRTGFFLGRTRYAVF